ncbi:MAG: desulfoferrodoxin [Clostridiales bacterium]|nr:desulfoferrodoxin [Clostridiales bacterium]
MSFYHCKHCGNIIFFAHNAGVPVVCCGENMQQMTAGTVDASKEKHVPEVTISGQQVTVKVGAVEHPMEEKHYITFVALQSEQALQYRQLKPGDAPVATFALAKGDRALAAYEHCNLHGLWKADA